TYRVGGTGKPVRFRRGPATVTGEAHRTRASAQATGTSVVPGRRGRVEPGSQETHPRPSSRMPSRKGVAHMQVVLSRAARTGLALVLALAALALVTEAAPAAPATVHLRVEGSSATLFDGSVATDGKTLTKDGSGPHPCDGTNNGANPTPGPTMTAALDD